MNVAAAQAIAAQLTAVGKGLIAADESNATCEKRFSAVGIPCTEETRRAYRELIVTTPGLEEFVSGIILYDETIHQKTSKGIPFPEVLSQKGIVPGIKVDTGTIDFPNHSGEKLTQGLNGLHERIAAHKELGAMFTKWRMVFSISQTTPSEAGVAENAQNVAQYVAISQSADMVPIVEPEILFDGEHSIEQCYHTTTRVLTSIFKALTDRRIMFEGMILKASMVLAGRNTSRQSTPDEVAEWTLRCLNDTVPTGVAGIVFLSGGQSDEQATANLNAIARRGPHRWPLTFSYSRAIQHPALEIWAANMQQNVEKAQAALLFRARMNSLASQGMYVDTMEQERPY